jgi:neurofibromin 1
MEIRHPLEWHCKQMDHFVGLTFSSNFNFALVGHLLKGKVCACVCSYNSFYNI